MANNKNYTCIIIIFLIIASCAAFGRVAGNGFINFDDNIYITENNYIKSGINVENIKWAATAVVMSNWHPLTLISHMLDWHIFGANPSGHHLISLLLHMGSVLLLFLFLNKTTKNPWPSAFAAAVFALHPLRVESVAWASERKDVLSMFFGMASVYAYSFYAEKSKASRYLLCLALFILALMSKPAMVTLPFVLMLLDYWPLKRWQEAIDKKGKSLNSAGPIIWEKVPFILLAISLSIVTFLIQKISGSVHMEGLSLFMRVANAVVSYAAYLEKIFWPVNLAVFYPYEYSMSLHQILIPALILTGVTGIVIYKMKKLPFLFVGWFWYLGTLIPVIGLVQAGGQSMADRYTYLSSIGVAVMAAWGIPYLFPSRVMRKRILFPAAMVVFAVLAAMTWRQCGYWKNSITLYQHTLSITKNNSMIHNNLGLALYDEGKFREAVDHFSETIHRVPDNADAYFNRGNAYAMLGRHQLAVNDYKEVIRMMPDNAAACTGIGNIYAGLKKYQTAIGYYSEAIRQQPGYAGAYYNRGAVYAMSGRHELAVENYNETIRLMPDNARAFINRGAAYFKLGQYQRAIEDFNRAIELKQYNAEAYNNLGNVYLLQGNTESGCYYAQKACESGNCAALGDFKRQGYCR